MRIAFVEWCDAASNRGPLSQREAKAMGPLVTLTGGVLLAEDEDTVRIAQDCWDSGGEPYCRDASVIPRKYITYMKTWDVPKRRS